MSSAANSFSSQDQFAIVAQACRFPGADSADALWQQLLAGDDCRSELTDTHLGAPVSEYLGSKGQSDRFYCAKGGFIEDFCFDATGFKLPPESLQNLDASQQWLLTVTREALSEAGISGPALNRTGLILGALSFPDKQTNELCLPLYHNLVKNALANTFQAQARDPVQLAAMQSLAGSQSINHSGSALTNASNAASTVAQALGLGPHYLSLDAACASSLYAIKLACDYLASGKADTMLAGAVSGADPLFIHMGFSIFQAYPENGVSAPFSPDSQGLFAGEGAAMLVIKRLDDAIKNQDKILGVIQGVGLSNDGRGQFVLSPNPKGQHAAFERAWDRARCHNITPEQLEVVECHATGTPLGDKVELGSMDSFFGAHMTQEQLPVIGSAKGNVGHLLTAAGMVSMVKTLKAMDTRTLPASPYLSDAQTQGKQGFGARINTHNQPWPVKQTNGDTRIAGISAFGFGGCNAHLVLSDNKGIRQASKLENSMKPALIQPTPLHICGVAAHVGPNDNLQALANTIKRQGSGLVPLPPKRWKGMEQYLVNKAPKGGYIADFELDMMQFKLPATEQDKLIPQQLLLLKQADIAIRDAGLDTGSKTAVLVTMETEPELHQFRGRVELHTLLPQYLHELGIELTGSEYAELEPLVMDAVLSKAQLNQYTSFIGNIMASRVAALWDFSGPAFTLSAGEHGFARGIQVAQQLLASGDADAVVLCSVDLAGNAERCLLQTTKLSPADAAAALVLTQADAPAAYGTLHAPEFNAVPAVSSLSLSQAQSQLQPQSQLQSESDKGVAALADTLLTQAGRELNRHLICGDGESLDGAEADYPARRLGYAPAASGTIAAIQALLCGQGTSLITANTERLQSGLLLSQTPFQSQNLSRRLDNPVKPHASRSLIKRFSLGGESISLKVQQAVRQILARRLPAPAEHQVSAKPASSQQADSVQMSDTQTNNIQTDNAVNRATSELNLQRAAMDSATTHLEQNRALLANVHIEFLNSRRHGLEQADALLRQEIADILGQPRTVAKIGANIGADIGTNIEAGIDVDSAARAETAPAAQLTIDTPIAADVGTTKNCIWDYDDLLEYAEGSIAKVFGPEYAEIDSFKRRVRLPSRDYLLVSRVTRLNASLNKNGGEYQPSTMTTEYDIPVDAPFLVDGQIPWAVAVESGQCDLMLISYLGIDFENRGDRVYRLLDCTLTFLGDLPRGGDTLRYDISINHYARNGDTLLFFFSYRCYVGDTLILKMDNGCAGFFTDKELEDGKGVIRTEAEETARRNAPKQSFTPLLNCSKTRFNRADLEPLLTAELAACFGDSHLPKDQSETQSSLRFASHKFMMIEEVSSLNPQGGAWGLGEVVGHKFLEPDHWYFPCHFKDDEVMAGSLMAEGCGQLLQFYMLWLGMHTQMQDGRFQPLIDAPQKVRCRGQVLPQSGTLTYRMEVTQLSMHPTPRARANIDILLDGKVVVDFQNLGVMLKENAECTHYSGAPGQPDASTELGASGQSAAAETLSEAAPLMQKVADEQAPANKGVVPFKHIPAPDMARFANRTPDSLPFTPWHMFEFATGDIENCFGPEFAVYRGMVPPRTPCGDLQLTTSVTQIEGRRGDFKTVSRCRAEYEVPFDAWYFKANSHASQMPYSVLMEIALQPNGFLSGYLGTTLNYQKEPLFFRNLDGKGELLRDVDLQGQTIINDTVLHSTVFSGANIIQKFSFTLSTKTASGTEPFYVGEAVFGYFNDHALTHQAGLDRGQTREPWHIAESQPVDIELDLSAINAFTPEPNKPHWHLPGGQLNFVDTIAIIKDGGEQGLGYVYGERTVDASDWFFPCHFHQDPVMPGSLGVEAMLELLQAFALETGLGDGFSNPRFSWPQSTVNWKYRGQITPHNKQMSLELHITAITQDDDGLQITANASLSKDQLRIYEISDLAIRIAEAE